MYTLGVKASNQATPNYSYASEQGVYKANGTPVSGTTVFK